MRASFSANEAAAWVGGELLSGSAETNFSGVSIDSRKPLAGRLFIAIRGPSFDAHRFLGDAVRGGATGLLVEKGSEPDSELRTGVAVIRVADTTQALGALASGWRAGFVGPLVAVTGSNGKTTTKEMCAAILAAGGPCLKNEGNLNNEFGLPLTLLQLRPEHRWAVVELGMNHRGEIARLAAIARPDVGVLTNVGSAHIEHLGSRERIAREKGDLFEALPADGVAVVNCDDPLALEQAARAAGRVVGFGRNPDAAFRAEGVRFEAAGSFAFELVTADGRMPLRVPGLGETAVDNALAAAAATLSVGASVDQVATGLANFRSPTGRMTRVDLPGDVTLIDDSYNANPQSVRAALAALTRLAASDRSVAVLGDMGELGDGADEAHQQMGAVAAQLGVRLLVAVGERAALIVDAAIEAGLPRSHTFSTESPDAASAALRDRLRPDDWVLVKGSRSMRMEQIVESLKAKGGN